MSSITETHTLDDIRNLKGVFLADAVKNFLPAGSSKLKADEKREALVDLWAAETSKNTEAKVAARKQREAATITAEPIAPEALKVQTEGRTARDFTGVPMMAAFRRNSYHLQTGKPNMTAKQKRRYNKKLKKNGSAILF